MHVVIDARLLLPQMTGIGRYLMGLTRAFYETSGDEKIELWLQANLPDSHPVWSLASDRISLRKMDINHMNFRQQKVIPIELYRCRPDVFHHPHFDLPFLVSGPVVVTVHDLKYISQRDYFPRFSSTKRLLMWFMMWFAVRRAQRVIAVSENTRQDILRFLGADPRKVIVVPEGVEEHYFQSPSAAVLQSVEKRYHLSQPFVLFVGERRPHKNLVGLIRAFDIFLRSNSYPHQLIIVGKGYADYQEPERVSSELGITHRVRFFDYVPDFDLPSLYWLSDVFVTLSLYEGVGLPVLEAMASGTPVVAARKTSLPEVVGNAGLLVDTDNIMEAALAMGRLVSGGELRQTFIHNGLLRARQFTWERSANATMAVYKQIIDS